MTSFCYISFIPELFEGLLPLKQFSLPFEDWILTALNWKNDKDQSCLHCEFSRRTEIVWWIFEIFINFNRRFRRSKEWHLFAIIYVYSAWLKRMIFMINFNSQFYLANDFIDWNDFWNTVYLHRDESFLNIKFHQHSPVSQLCLSYSINTSEFQRTHSFTTNSIWFYK